MKNVTGANPDIDIPIRICFAYPSERENVQHIESSPPRARPKSYAHVGSCPKSIGGRISREQPCSFSGAQTPKLHSCKRQRTWEVVDGNILNHHMAVGLTNLQSLEKISDATLVFE